MKKPKTFLMFVIALEGDKTDVWSVHQSSLNPAMRLGWVKWFAPWRRYCFYSENGQVILDSGCVGEVKEFLDFQNARHKRLLAARKSA